MFKLELEASGGCITPKKLTKVKIIETREVILELDPEWYEVGYRTPKQMIELENALSQEDIQYMINFNDDETFKREITFEVIEDGQKSL